MRPASELHCPVSASLSRNGGADPSHSCRRVRQLICPKRCDLFRADAGKDHLGSGGAAVSNAPPGIEGSNWPSGYAGSAGTRPVAQRGSCATATGGGGPVQLCLSAASASAEPADDYRSVPAAHNELPVRRRLPHLHDVLTVGRWRKKCAMKQRPPSVLPSRHGFTFYPAIPEVAGPGRRHARGARTKAPSLQRRAARLDGVTEALWLRDVGV